MAICGWCKRSGIVEGQSHTVPQSSVGQISGRGGNAPCRGYQTYVRLGVDAVAAVRSETPREVRG